MKKRCSRCRRSYRTSDGRCPYCEDLPTIWPVDVFTPGLANMTDTGAALSPDSSTTEGFGGAGGFSGGGAGGDFGGGDGGGGDGGGGGD